MGKKLDVVSEILRLENRYAELEREELRIKTTMVDVKGKIIALTEELSKLEAAE